MPPSDRLKHYGTIGRFRFAGLNRNPWNPIIMQKIWQKTVFLAIRLLN